MRNSELLLLIFLSHVQDTFRAYPKDSVKLCSYLKPVRWILTTLLRCFSPNTFVNQHFRAKVTLFSFIVFTFQKRFLLFSYLFIFIKSNLSLTKLLIGFVYLMGYMNDCTRWNISDSCLESRWWLSLDNRIIQVWRHLRRCAVQPVEAESAMWSDQVTHSA